MRHAEDLGRNQEGGCSGRASAELEKKKKYKCRRIEDAKRGKNRKY